MVDKNDGYYQGHHKEDEEGFLGLDIGCGKEPKDGWKALDIIEFPGVHKYDMTQDKLPYEYDSVDAIRCINTLEHISREYYRHLFNDWWECMKIDGTVEIVVPNFAKSVGHALNDITHVSLWVPGMVKYLSGERPRYADYGFRKWKIIKSGDLEKEERDLQIIMTPLTKHGKKYGR